MLAKEDLRRLVLTKDLEPLFELEECFAGGTQLAASLPHRKKEPLPPVCDQIAKLHPSQSVFGPGTFLYLSVAGIQEALQGQIGGASQAARAAGQRAAQAAAKQGRLHGPAAAGRQRGGAAGAQPVPEPARPGGAPLRHHLDPAAGRPQLRQPSRLRPVEARRHAQGALRLPVPQQERGADHRPPASRHDRRGATRGDRPLPPGRLEPALQAHRRQLHRHRRPCRRRCRRPGAAQPDAAAAGRSGPGDGSDAAPDPAAAAASASSRGRRGGGCHDDGPGVRLRRFPDRRGDRDAAGAGWAGRGLRDPVPGSLQRSQGRGGPTGARSRDCGGRRGTRDRRGLRGDDRGLRGVRTVPEPARPLLRPAAGGGSRPGVRRRAHRRPCCARPLGAARTDGGAGGPTSRTRALQRSGSPPQRDRGGGDRDGAREAQKGARRWPAACGLRMGCERRDRGGDRHPRSCAA